MRADFLNFESPNKADYIIVQSKWDIPYHAQTYIRENMNSPIANDILKFIQNAYNDQKLDKRSPKVKNAKKYLLRIKNRGTECYNFTDEQLLHIAKYSRSRKVGELLRDECMFPNADFQKINGLTPWVLELQTSLNLEYLGPAEVYEEIEELQDYGGDYVAPKTDETVVKKILKACPSLNWSINRRGWDSFQKRCIRVLKGNLGLMKFLLTINSFKTAKDKQLFETEFIRSCYDKPDMIPDDINSCMMLAEEYTRSMQIREMINLLDDKLKSCLAGDEKAGNQMALAEQAKAKTNELEKCNNNIQKLTKSLNETFATRNKQLLEFNSSLAPYIAFCCDEKKREELLKAKRAYELNVLEKELDKIDQEPKDGEIHGISIEEIMGFKHEIME